MKTLLLVDDDEDDVFIMKMACQRSGIPHQLRVVTDGEMAISYLSGQGIHSDGLAYPTPDVVFLDLNMPKRDGLQVLEWIRAQPHLKTLPVVMLTGSMLARDIERAYELGVTSYLEKMACQAEFGQAVRIILRYWLELNILRPSGVTEKRREFLPDAIETETTPRKL